MKLQKTNKYANKFKISLLTIILGTSLLNGCSTVALEEIERPVEVVKVTPSPTTLSPIITPVPKDKKYFLNYYKLTDEQIEEELLDYDIKYPNALWRMNQITTLVVKDEDNNLKVLQTIERTDFDNNIVHFYDVFTEERLFDMPASSEIEIIYTGEIVNKDFSLKTNAIPYFDNKEIVEYGICGYACTFVTDHIDYYREKDGIDYINPGNYVYNMFYPNEYIDADIEFKMSDIARSYILSLPKDTRVTSKELGLKFTYKEERKYADFWKIGENEINERMENLGLVNEKLIYNMSKISSLILKDSNGEYKVLNVISSKNNSNTIEFYDLYSEKYLFTIEQSDNFKYVDNDHFDVDFSKVVDSIPYFEDKEFLKLDICTGSNYFVNRYIDELSIRDGIEYEVPDYAFFVCFYPRGNFSDGSLKFSKEEIAKCYVMTVPHDSQVTEKDLEKENNKVLVK